MCKSFFVFTLIGLLLLSGCGVSREEPVTKADFPFVLPQGAEYADITDTSCSILVDGQPVGGIIFTGLRGKRIEKVDNEDVLFYIESLTPMPLMSEYMSMLFSDETCAYLSVSHKVTDTETDQVTYYRRFLFVKDGAVYDLWLDEALLEDDMRKALVDAVIAS